MIIRKFTVQYVSDGPSAEPIAFNVVTTHGSISDGTININAELVQQVLGKSVGDVVRLASGERCLVVDIDQEIQLGDILKELNRTRVSREDYDWVSLGIQLAQLLSESVRINPFEFRKSTCESIVSAFLNENRIVDAIALIERLKQCGVPNLDNLSMRLKEIEAIQQSVSVRDITAPFLLRQLADLHKKIRAYKKARALYERSLELEPNNYYTLNSLGGVCKHANWLNDGIEYYKLALKSPGNTPLVSLNGLGAIYRKQKDFMQALSCYTQALELDNSNEISHRGIGAVYFDMQHYLKGQEHFKQAGIKVGYLFELVDEYTQAGLVDQAAKCLETILEIDEHNKNAKQLLRNIALTIDNP